MNWRVAAIAAALVGVVFLGGCGLVHHNVHSFVQEPFPKSFPSGTFTLRRAMGWCLTQELSPTI